MKRLLFILPIFLFAGCSSKGYYAYRTDVESITSGLQSQIYELRGSIKVLDDKINAVDKGTTKLFGDYNTSKLSNNEGYMIHKNEICADETFIAPGPADGYWNCYDVEKWCDEYCNFGELTKTDLCIPSCLEKLK